METTVNAAGPLEAIVRLRNLPPEGSPLRKLGARLAELLDESQWAEVERMLFAVADDSARLDFIEQRIRKSYTGVSFDWVPSVEGDPSGYRMMWRHTIHDQKKSLRAAIDEAMSKTPNA